MLVAVQNVSIIVITSVYVCIATIIYLKEKSISFCVVYFRRQTDNEIHLHKFS